MHNGATCSKVCRRQRGPSLTANSNIPVTGAGRFFRAIYQKDDIQKLKLNSNRQRLQTLQRAKEDISPSTSGFLPTQHAPRRE